MTIITTKKPFEEVLGALRNAKKISLVSCGSCAAMCKTGGTENAKELAEKLEKEGYMITVVSVTEEVCDDSILKKLFRKIDKDLKETDVIITLSCGLGVASITEALSDKYPHVPVITASNTEFMGITNIEGFYQRCAGCGDCVLNETGGICPITTCAKSLMNGPCGGVLRGKCEVGNYEEDCGWILIYNRLKELDRLELFTKVRDPRDWSGTGHQRKVLLEED